MPKETPTPFYTHTVFLCQILYYEQTFMFMYPVINSAFKRFDGEVDTKSLR